MPAYMGMFAFLGVGVAVTLGVVIFSMLTAQSPLTYDNPPPPTRANVARNINRLTARRRRRNFQQEGFDCTICLDPLNRSTCVTLPCDHQFHKNCFSGWSYLTCPNCRLTFSRHEIQF